ncbi:hypothetical protein HPP92_022588 [Vanilla planifolia]|uniref:Uncharacterized protein n=1 Tax=Vanilla planifolia TaxID=51239 RepID=A0A835UFT6_VANPL|nr:hypothetical protein HPP92_022588 [Vanilla planifolia]
MASSATGTWRSIPRPQRKPLHPINPPVAIAAVTCAVTIYPKKPISTLQRPSEGRSGKENQEIFSDSKEMELFPAEASLREELEAARQRTERLRREKERAEIEMREMDRAMDRWIRETENRTRALAAVEMELRRVLRAMEHQSSSARSSPFPSLRAREAEKRRQEGQLQEKINAEASDSKRKE